MDENIEKIKYEQERKRLYDERERLYEQAEEITNILNEMRFSKYNPQLNDVIKCMEIQTKYYNNN